MEMFMLSTKTSHKRMLKVLTCLQSIFYEKTHFIVIIKY